MPIGWQNPTTVTFGGQNQQGTSWSDQEQHGLKLYRRIVTECEMFCTLKVFVCPNTYRLRSLRFKTSSQKSIKSLGNFSSTLERPNILKIAVCSIFKPGRNSRFMKLEEMGSNSK